MTRFVLTRAAARDIREIYAYISADRPAAASKVRERLFVALMRIAAHPGIGHIREDLTDKAVRFWPVSRYVIVYDPLHDRFESSAYWTELATSPACCNVGVVASAAAR
jgi:toxin ParE1/3/4